MRYELAFEKCTRLDVENNCMNKMFGCLRVYHSCIVLKRPPLIVGPLTLVQGTGENQDDANLYLAALVGSSLSHRFIIEFEPSTFAFARVVFSIMCVLFDAKLH